MSTTQNENLKHALCYIPMVAIVILFVEDKKDEKLKKHIRYWIMLFLIYILLTSILSIISFGLAFMLNWLITLAYFVLSWILWYKAYSWEEWKVEFLDDIEGKIKDTFK